MYSAAKITVQSKKHTVHSKKPIFWHSTYQMLLIFPTFDKNLNIS